MNEEKTDSELSVRAIKLVFGGKTESESVFALAK
jgi:hypothetical protein